MYYILYRLLYFIYIHYMLYRSFDYIFVNIIYYILYRILHFIYYTLYIIWIIKSYIFIFYILISVAARSKA